MFDDTELPLDEILDLIDSPANWGTGEDEDEDSGFFVRADIWTFQRALLRDKGAQHA